MTHVVAVANEKGGVGKSTTAVNLAAGLAIKLRYQRDQAERVLLIDLDPQMNGLMGIAYGDHQSHPEESIANLLVSETPPSPQRLIRRSSHHDNLFFLPSNNAALKEAAYRVRSLPGADLRLRNAIEAIRQDYAFILIDTPPNAGAMLANAIMAATHVLIPIEMSYQGASGLGALHQTILRTVQAHRRNDLEIIGYLPTMYEGVASDSGVILERLQERYGQKVFEPIHRARAIQQANGAHLDIFMFRPPRTWEDGLESSTRATKEYANLVNEVMRRTGEKDSSKEAAHVR